MALADSAHDRRRALNEARHRPRQSRWPALAVERAQAIGDGGVNNTDGVDGINDADDTLICNRWSRYNRRCRCGTGIWRRCRHPAALFEPALERLGQLLVVERLHQEVVHPGLQTLCPYV